MANFFLQIWLFFKSLPLRLRHCNIKLVLTTIAIALFSWFYIQSQYIYTHAVDMKIDRIGRYILSNDSISRRMNGYIDIRCGVNGSLSENASAHGTAQDYIYPHDAWYGDSTLIFKSHWIPKSELDSIRDGFLATGNSPSAVDSITLLYLFEIQRSVPQYQFLSIHNNITQEHLDSLNKYSYVLDYPSPLLDKSSSKELTLRYNMGSSKYRWAKVDIGTTSRLFNYFSAIDISQLYVVYKISTFANHRQIRLNSDVESVRSITFDFVGNTVFSDMTPKPDEITMNSITFNDPEKITKIRENGLTFHVNFTDNTNVQTARMFFVTTLLSILIAYWVALVTQGIKNIISKRSKERREKQQKTQRS